jgi:hypothetical protein
MHGEGHGPMGSHHGMRGGGFGGPALDPGYAWDDSVGEPLAPTMGFDLGEEAPELVD